MTTNEIITELIRYDDDGDSLLLKTLNQSERMSYLTDLNILHRVAVKVWDSLCEMLLSSNKKKQLVRKMHHVIDYMFTSPNEQGEHLQLAEALVNAIRYISSNKAQ